MSGPSRWWTYQRERFPLAVYLPLVAVFSLAAVAYSASLRDARPSVAAWTVAGVFALGLFAQLRIADEHKDIDDDSRFRPYRAVPRGLVTLRELSWIALGAAAVQLAAALILSPRLLVPLAAVWVYLGLMTKEFFVPEWLRSRPVAYLLSHMVIMPLLAILMLSTDSLPTASTPFWGLAPLLGLTFANGIVLEVGRKIRAPESEEDGVSTYTFLWGRGRALSAWLGALVVAAVLLVATGVVADILTAATAVGAVGLVAAAALSGSFARSPVASVARWFEPVSAVWIAASYLVVASVVLKS